MLRTAVETLVGDGVTVSFDHIRLEDVIREAGVSRTAVYRRWPRKDLFLGDVVLELAQLADDDAEASARAATALICRTVEEHVEWLGSPDGRRRLAFEVIRQVAWQDFQDDTGQVQKWQTYLVLTVTSLSLPEGELRDSVRHAMQRSEADLTEWLAHSYRAVANLLGLRPRAGVDGFEVVAELGIAMMRGLILKALNAREQALRAVSGQPFDDAADWTLPGLGFASVIDTFLEPDPDVDWDEARTAEVLARLRSTEDLFTGGAAPA